MTLPFSTTSLLEERCNRLEGLLTHYGSIAIAFSGGVDSTFLAWFVLRALKRKLFGLFVLTPFVSRREREHAVSVAKEIGLELEEIPLDPTQLDTIRENPLQRCYFCKREIMGRVKERAIELGCSRVIDGTHLGDSTGQRPGIQALQELGILSPLSVAGFLKSEIRQLSRLAKISTWNKPSQSCLATRIPYGTPLTSELISRIEECEGFLLDAGVSQVRVRAHGDVARIEVNPADFALLLRKAIRTQIINHFRRLGFDHVCLDLDGFRSGSMDGRHVELSPTNSPQEDS